MAYNSKIKNFFEVYTKLAKQYKLSYQMSFGLRKDVIKIYQGEGESKKQVVKVETEDAAECWEKATQSLRGWVQGKQNKM